MTLIMIVRTISEIEALVTHAEDLARSEEADGYVAGALATLHWLTNPERPAPDLDDEVGFLPDDDDIPGAEEDSALDGN